MFTRDSVVASFCFVLSGAAALVYQVAWQRLLTLTTGVSVPSVAAVHPEAVDPAHEFNEDLQPRDEFVRPRKPRR